jgi:hypothetical protein
MSENLIDSIAPQLAPPVSREPILSASEAEGGAGPSIIQTITILAITFADDSAE